MTFQRIKPIGGEAEFHENTQKALTQSGRFSLKLILENEELRKHHFFIPDYICSTIILMLEMYNIRYSFYKIKADLKPDWTSINQEIDVLYVINYFGQLTQLPKSINAKTILIIDDVFFPYPRIPTVPNPYFSFNSLRKITSVADGSILLSNKKLPHKLVRPVAETNFTRLKYQAKSKKYEYINHNNDFNIQLEKDYLADFERAELILDNQEDITSISLNSQIGLFEFYIKIDDERKRRNENYFILKNSLSDHIVNIESDFYSFAILKLPNAEKLKLKLMEYKIYLPNHWPKMNLINNISTQWLSVPVDSRYNNEDMQRIVNTIKILTNE
ncbi:hypothetical protein [Shewanella mangrovisoli]|uniref:hypothetical protein n=1 Tax=Shewanella mangrovisoli TaxID=2864211 RepID=UPI001C65C012|nr:hypothetical protein [Shewanella mangrovisoli]QYK10364.1 hypothetical protein K0H60_06695 [Shewanella mangrovisoli]